MRAVQPGAYGDVFADVYDAWYHSISDVGATVDAVTKLARGGRVLELGVGTGRLALPLAAAGCEVHGLDASPAMIRALRAKVGGEELPCVLGDMARLPLTGPYAVVFIAFNTFFNLTTAADQENCVRDVSQALSAEGALVIEAFIPSPEPPGAERGESRRSDDAGGVVVTTTVRDPTDQTVRGTHRHLPAQGPPQDYPWTIRYLHTDQLDELCRSAGLQLAERWSSFDRGPFHPDGERHVSVYRRPPTLGAWQRSG